MAIIPQGAFIFDANTSSPQELARKRAIVAQLMGQRSAPRNVGEGLVALGDGIVANVMGRRADEAEKVGMASASEAFNPILDAFNNRVGAGGFPDAPNPGNSASMATMPAPDYASARVSQAHGDSGGFNGDLRDGIIATAEAIGADPLDLATAISYETAGTFDPTKKGPRTQWGQHRGLIQFGEPQAQQHGVDWNDPLGSQLGPEGAIASYFRASGFKPGMSGLDLYSTINAGAPGRYRASDANNGGAPGSVRDKWENQMGGHRRKAQALLGDASLRATPSAPEPSNGLTPDALQQWAFANYAPAQGNGAVDAVNALGMAQPTPVAETEADILAQEAAMAGQDPQAFAPAPPLSPPQTVQDRPVAPMQVADASGAFPEMAGQNPRAIPAPTGSDLQTLLRAASNPWLNDQQRSVVNMLLQQQMQAQDPMRQLDMDYKRAQIGKLTRDATGPAELGLTPQYGVDANGNPVLIQIGKDGKAIQTAMPEGVTLSKEPIRMDAGTHYVLLDPITRQPVGQIPKENREAARETAIGKIEGESLGEAQVNLGGTLQKADQSIALIDQMLTHPGFEAATGLSSVLDPRNYIAGTDATNFNVMRKQLEGKAFLEAFESLKGGGQITEVEGRKATEAIGRLSTVQSEDAYREALMELRGILELGKQRSVQRAGGQPSGDGWQDMGGVRIRRKQ